MKSLPEELKIRDLYGKGSIAIPEVQKQINKVDCGCFAIAWAVLLAIGEKPENITLDKNNSDPPYRVLADKEHSLFPHTSRRSHRVRTKNITLT